MKKIRCFAFVTIFVLLSAGFVQAQKNKLITADSAGPLKIRMTVANARKVAKPLIISKGTRGFEGEVDYTVKNGQKRVMTFIEYSGGITSVEIWDKSFHTADGVSVGMLLSDLEKKYGKLKKIRIGEQDDFEYAIFTKQPKGMMLRIAVRGKGKRAGIYPDESFTTTEYNPGIYLQTIQIYGEDFSEQDTDEAEENSDKNEADKIIYNFGDRSVSPQYHRSYTITATGSGAKLVVDSYGKIIAESEVTITADDFAAILKKIRTGGIKKEKRTGKGGCTGGTSEGLGLYKGEKEIFKARVSHCGGQDLGDLSGDVAGVKAKMSSFFPDFEKLIRKDVPSN